MSMYKNIQHFNAELQFKILIEIYQCRFDGYKNYVT